MEQLEKIYNPKDVEKRWEKSWEDCRLFHGDETSTQESFSIVIPPPNITGSLHIGHAFNSTLQDILIRWKRMMGFTTLWQPGTDHAGIATQNVVERQLHSEGTNRQDLGREEFIKRVWRWRDASGGSIFRRREGAGVREGRFSPAWVCRRTGPTGSGRRCPRGRHTAWCGR